MKEKVYSIKKASEILGVSDKTLYARLKNEKYIKCFIIVPNAKKNFIYYKTECVEKELNNKMTNKDKSDFTTFYYEIVDAVIDKYHLNFLDDGEKKLKKILNDKLADYDNKKYLIAKIIDCNPATKDEMKNFVEILNKVKEDL